MDHSFLIEAGRWVLQGDWLERNGTPTAIKGLTIIAWNQEDWFTMVTKLVFPNSDRGRRSSAAEGRCPSSSRLRKPGGGATSPGDDRRGTDDLKEISSEYRGRLAGGDWQYTYVLRQSLLGRIEGEGWITANSIIQRYWVLDDLQRRSGFETFYRLNRDTYYLCSGIMKGHYLTSTMEATLERQT